MKVIKTYEGFFDFFKKKEKREPVQLDELIECLYDLTDEHRIKNELNGDRFDGIFADEDVVFKKRSSMGLEDGHDAFMNDELYRDKNFKVRKNAIAFEMIYNPSEISDSEVNELLLDCRSKLEIYDCKISFFIGWGRAGFRYQNPFYKKALNSRHDEGYSSDKEWSDFMTMIDKTVKRSPFPQRPRNITIKIESPSGFN
jgi:hypothetical protein